MQIKEAVANENADVISLSQTMNNDIESFYNMNKEIARDLIFNTLISINLDLQSSYSVYLNLLMETVNRYLKVDRIIILSKEEGFADVFSISMKTFDVVNAKTNSENILRIFDDVFNKGTTPRTFDMSGDLSKLLSDNQDQEVDMFDFENIKGVPSFKISKISKDSDSGIIGLFCNEVKNNSSFRQGIWDLLV